jgi:tetratricopeptide (TPR) repeat protein
MASQSISVSVLRERSCAARRSPSVAALRPLLDVLLAALVALALSFVLAPRAYADPAIKATVSATTGGGYARLVFSLAEESEADVRLANGIVVITFKKPIDVSVERLSASALGYIGAARRDPDGTAVRLALAQKVTVNSMAAGEKLFVDLLPESWTGVMPGLPQDVIEDLARRARDAEKKARAAQAVAAQKKLPPIRVRVGTQPTFTRYVFELPAMVPVATDRDKDKLALVFDAPLKFDLADVSAALPPTVGSIESDIAEDSATVRFSFVGKVDVRTFREDNSFVVDVSPVEAKTPVAGDPAPRKPGDLSLVVAPPDAKSPPLEAPATIPAKSVPPARSEAPAKPVPPVAVRPPKAPPKAVEAASVPDKPAPPPAASVPAKAPPAAEVAAKPAAPNGTVVVELRRQEGGALKLTFPFATATPGAVFRRFDTVWVIFDSAAPIDLTALESEAGRSIRSITVTKSGGGQVIRIKLEQLRLASATVEGLSWAVSLGNVMLNPTAPLTLMRSAGGAARATSTIPFDEPAHVYHLTDPDIGDTLLVVTALGPARGFIKAQDFVEFRALASTHGVVIQSLADDLTVETAPDKIVIARPAGLTLSATGSQDGEAASRPGGYRPVLFDAQSWAADRQAQFNERQAQLMRASSTVPPDRRAAARLELARFYLGREFYPEAKAVLDVTVAEDRPSAEDPSGLVLRAIANVMMARGTEALKDLSDPIIGNQSDAALWRALALMLQGRWTEARESFKAAEAAIATLPVELQRIALREQMRAAIEVRDFADASRLFNDLETLEIPREMRPVVAVLSGRLAEGLGRVSDALTAYRSAVESTNRPAAAQARLREIVLRYTTKDMKAADTITALEELTTAWRGDDTEMEALQLLARLYTEEARFRDAFMLMRTALSVHPNSPMTRRVQDEAAASFDALFLGGKGDPMPPVEALSLFYDFRELTPIGRRGDEMIRKLADRLVSVDLLDQAAELLQHQVDHRLQGAARAQVATRLATVYLMARKPDRALTAIRSTRSGDLNNELRNQRLLLEARALSDTGRHDVALEVITNMQGREVDRLRSDILWPARRWREASEQLEKLYGDRWREFAPLTDAERPDILRAAIGYVLGDDKLGLQRFREKYAAKMSEGPDAKLFAVLTGPLGSANPEFPDAAKTALAANTLDQFLRDLRAHYPDAPLPAAGKPPTPPPGTKASNDAPAPPARTAAR